MKILIVEDDLIIGQNLKENLEELGYEVVGPVANSIQAKLAVSNEQVDLCLVDIYLKGSPKNGIEFVDDIRCTHDLPIIYLTSFDDVEYRDRAKKTDPAAYLLKPVSKRQVDIAIDFAMSKFLKEKSDAQQIEHICPFYRKENVVFIKNGSKYERVNLSEIIYIEASGTYSTIYTTNGQYLLSSNIGKVLDSISYASLFRCHRSFAINRSFVHAFDDVNIYLVFDKELVSVPISRSYREQILIGLPRLKG